MSHTVDKTSHEIKTQTGAMLDAVAELEKGSRLMKLLNRFKNDILDRKTTVFSLDIDNDGVPECLQYEYDAGITTIRLYSLRDLATNSKPEFMAVRDQVRHCDPELANIYFFGRNEHGEITSIDHQIASSYVMRITTALDC